MGGLRLPYVSSVRGDDLGSMENKYLVYFEKLTTIRPRIYLVNNCMRGSDLGISTYQRRRIHPHFSMGFFRQSCYFRLVISPWRAFMH
jgi:hypothetical protein